MIFVLFPADTHSRWVRLCCRVVLTHSPRQISVQRLFACSRDNCDRLSSGLSQCVCVFMCVCVPIAAKFAIIIILLGSLACTHTHSHNGVTHVELADRRSIDYSQLHWEPNVFQFIALGNSIGHTCTHSRNTATLTHTKAGSFCYGGRCDDVAMWFVSQGAPTGDQRLRSGRRQTQGDRFGNHAHTFVADERPATTATWCDTVRAEMWLGANAYGSPRHRRHKHSHSYAQSLHTHTHKHVAARSCAHTSRLDPTATTTSVVQLRELCILQVHFMEYIVLVVISYAYIIVVQTLFYSCSQLR